MYYCAPASVPEPCYSALLPRIAASSRVFLWVACEAGYSACLQPSAEPALKQYTCAEKRSRHFSAVCLDQCSLWRYALFESSSVGDLFLGPWLSASVATMGPLYLHILLLWDFALDFPFFGNYTRSHSSHPSCCRFIGEKCNWIEEKRSQTGTREEACRN